MPELAFIDFVRSRQPATPAVPVPAGDDLAALNIATDRGRPHARSPDDLILVGIDQVLEGVHFDLRVHSPREVGQKAMNRNLSDCAAMACLPVAAVVSLALPRQMPIEAVRELYLGIEAAGAAMDCPIVGGDTGTWAAAAEGELAGDGRLAVTVAILARSAGMVPVRRSGAMPGDSLFVTGALGGSILGRHLLFSPRVKEARAIVNTVRVTSMIDLSDGLSADLAHLCRESRCGAIIDSDLVPIHPDVHRLPPDTLSPLHHALHDGEDYELLFTSPAPAVHGAIRVGGMIAQPAIWLETRGVRAPLRPLGYEHAVGDAGASE